MEYSRHSHWFAYLYAGTLAYTVRGQAWITLPTPVLSCIVFSWATERTPAIQKPVKLLLNRISKKNTTRDMGNPREGEANHTLYK